MYNDFGRRMKCFARQMLEVTMDMTYTRRKIGFMLAAMEDTYLVAEGV
jgi:hypothetical protein